jgi:hypothetical protein
MDHEKFTAGYCSFADSDLAAIRMGRPVGIFPQREKILVGGAGFGAGGVGLGALGGCSFNRVRAAGAMRAAYSS